MADAKKCDRCGAFYKLYEGGTPSATVELEDDYMRTMAASTYDICPACAVKLLEFLGGEGKVQV